ncbi:Fic family protein [Runella sp.]|jgi:Fic family protein|uniref:Fic family protein n=1 Tax=Runella sp. TaxID=1960881 RepID=UPI00263331CF|nr:Fic family protein [Runella sp.]
MEALRQVAELKLDELRPLNKEQEAIVMQKFRLDWNYHSNKIEGNSLSYGETKALILFGITAQGKPLKDHIEITGHNEAVIWIEELVHQDFPMNEAFIRQLHTLLLKESYEVSAITPDGQPTKKQIQVGQYKSTPNHVLTKTGEIFRFATPEETPAKMHDLIEWFRTKQNESDLSPVLLAAEFHYRFIRIHPFDDGNGRLARILMNLILIQYGFPPVIIKTEDKAAYYSALQQADAGLFEPFVEYIAQNEIRSLDIMIRGAKGESIEDPDDLDKELALLEQRLKNAVNQTNEGVKSKEAILNLCNGSLKRLFDEIIDGSKSFLRFYPYFLNNIYVNRNSAIFYYPPPDNTFEQILEEKITEFTDSIALHSQFSTSNPIQFANGNFNYNSNIQIDFKSKSYCVNDELEKPYSEQLTDSEIKLIVRKELRKHKEFIESKINEIQQNAGNQ